MVVEESPNLIRFHSSLKAEYRFVGCNMLTKELTYNDRFFAEPIKSESKPRILIVEDDLTMQPIWEYILDRADKLASYEWVVTEAAAEHRLETAILADNPYDLIISDVFLADTKTGIDLWKRFGDLYSGRMILMSGHPQSRFQLYLGGAVNRPVFLQKPLVYHDCIEAIYYMLHN